jgi:hypothetical protein
MIPATLGVERLPEVSLVSLHHAPVKLEFRTDEVKVQHSLACLWLKAIDKSSGLGMEQSVLRRGG